MGINHIYLINKRRFFCVIIIYEQTKSEENNFDKLLRQEPEPIKMASKLSSKLHDFFNDLYPV